MSFLKKEIKKNSRKRINESLPNVEKYDSVPLPKRSNFIPAIFVSVGVMATTLAIVLPIVLSRNVKQNVSCNYIDDGAIISLFSDQLVVSNNADIAPPPTFNSVLKSKDNGQLAIIQRDFDSKKSENKYAFTLSKKGVDALKGMGISSNKKWRTIEAEIISMYNGCEILYDVKNDLKCVCFDREEKIPAIIDGRYVVAIYYEGESRVIEELIHNINNCQKKIDFFSVEGVEGNDGFLVENIPEASSSSILFAGNKIVDENGFFNVKKIHESYYESGYLDNDILHFDAGFFSNDKLGLVTPLINNNTIKYIDFKNVLPSYTSYYQSEEFLSKQDIDFVEHCYINTFQAYNIKAAQLVSNYSDYTYLRDKVFINGDPIPYYSEEFFNDNAIIFITYERFDDKSYFELHFKEIYVQEGYLAVKAEITTDKSKTLDRGRFTIADISKEKLATLEEEHVGYYLSIAD